MDELKYDVHGRASQILGVFGVLVNFDLFFPFEVGRFRSVVVNSLLVRSANVQRHDLL